MFNSLILSALRNRFLTALIFLIIVVGGAVAIRATPIDALPDLSENQVIVMTDWMGQSPKNVEDQVTYPLTAAFQGLPGVKAVRGSSQVGLSMVTVIFEDSVPYYFARDRVSERLRLAAASLPPGIVPTLGPDATGLGQIFMYTIEVDSKSDAANNPTLTDLRAIQDFQIRYALASVPGVAEVASVGGYTASYQILVDPVKLARYDISLNEVLNEIKMGNENVSGRVFNADDREIAIAAEGFFKSPAALEKMVIGMKMNESPLFLNDIATVTQTGAPRRAILADETGERVGGVVVMRFGENPLAVIEGVKTKLQEIKKSLPEGVSVVPFYDRTELIRGAVTTMTRVILEELAVTAVILALFLAHFGATLATAAGLLVGVILTFIFMYFAGVPSNIMSLGGVAISVGTMVDAGIVIIENIYRKLLAHPPRDLAERFAAVGAATLEVGRPILFAILITIVSFIPIFSLSGMEGKLFHPLAWTHLFGLAGALIAALFLVPLLAFFFVKRGLKHDHEIGFVRVLQKLYEPILRSALHHRIRQVVIVTIFAVASFALAFRIGSEFMPPLDEGSLMYMPITVADVSEARAAELLIETNKIIASLPEVAKVVGKAGRADTATDPSPLSMLETIITLKPKSEWRPGMTKGKLVRELNEKIKINQLWNGFTQPIIGRIDMISTGVRTQVGVKIFGDDPMKLEQLAIEAESILKKVPGGSGVVAVRNSGLKYLNIRLNETKLARAGVMRDEVLSLVSMGLGGELAGVTVDGRQRVQIEMRLAENVRADATKIGALLVPTEGGKRVPLSSVADIALEDGPAMIASENGLITAVVQMSVVGTDLGSFVNAAKQTLDRELKLPTGYTTAWTGQYEHQLRARATLAWVVPTVLLVIFILLFLAYRDLGLVAIVMTTIPLSLSGGLVGLLLADYNFSVAVWVGFVTLFGTAVSMTVVKVVYLENAYRTRHGLPVIEGEGHGLEVVGEPKAPTRSSIEEAIVEGATLRLRPILMTTLVTIIGLVPMLTSTGVGAEVTKPLAVVLIGGLVSAVVMTLTLVPVLFAWLRERGLTK